MPEAEAVLARDGATVGPDQLLADEGLQGRATSPSCPAGVSSATAPQRNTWPITDALQHRELVGLEPVEPGRKHRLHRSRHAERVDGGERLEASVPVDEQPVLDEHAQHLLEEERVAAGRAADRRRGLRVERPGELLEQLPAWSWGSGASWIAGPSQPARTSARSGRARQQTSTGASCTTGEILDEVEERRRRPLHVVEHDHDGLRAGERLEQAPDGPARRSWSAALHGRPPRGSGCGPSRRQARRRAPRRDPAGGRSRRAART